MSLKPGMAIRELGWWVDFVGPHTVQMVTSDQMLAVMSPADACALAEKFGIEEPKVVEFEFQVPVRYVGSFSDELNHRFGSFCGKRVKVTVEEIS